MSYFSGASDLLNELLSYLLNCCAYNQTRDFYDTIDTDTDTLCRFVRIVMSIYQMKIGQETYPSESKPR